jgi:hypothetical protein
MFRLLALSCLVATTAQAAAPDWRPSPEVVPTVFFEVPTQRRTPTLVPLRITTVLQGEAVVHDVPCGLMQGAASQVLLCRDLGRFPVTAQTQGRLTAFRVEVDGLQAWGPVISVDEDQTPDIQAATARWVDGWFWDGWVCDLDMLDIEACVSHCGGAFGVDSLTATPNPPNAPAGSEPDCDVSCTCTGGEVHDWTNTPLEVITPF